MPVFIIASTSADGFIAPTSTDSSKPSTNWTSSEDTKFFQEKTHAAGVIVMGRKTYETIPEHLRPLKDRLNVIYTSQPDKVPSSKPLTQYNPLPTKYHHPSLTTDLSPQDLHTKLKSVGCETIAICGGSSIYTQFLQAGVVDEIFLTLEPLFFGAGIPLFDKELNTKLHLVNTIDLSDQAKVLHYQIIKPSKNL